MGRCSCQDIRRGFHPFLPQVRKNFFFLMELIQMSIHYCKHDLFLLEGALVFIQVGVQCWYTTFSYVRHPRVLVFLPCTYGNVFRSTLRVLLRSLILVRLLIFHRTLFVHHRCHLPCKLSCYSTSSWYSFI